MNAIYISLISCAVVGVLSSAVVWKLACVFANLFARSGRKRRQRRLMNQANDRYAIKVGAAQTQTQPTSPSPKPAVAALEMADSLA